MTDLSDPSTHHRELADGAEDGLEPLEPLDPGSIEDFDAMLRAMSRTAFGGRSLGDAAEVLSGLFRGRAGLPTGSFMARRTASQFVGTARSRWSATSVMAARRSSRRDRQSVEIGRRVVHLQM